jgi:hypothetical protein
VALCAAAALPDFEEDDLAVGLWEDDWSDCFVPGFLLVPVLCVAGDEL